MKIIDALANELEQEEDFSMLNEKQKEFTREYGWDYNAARAYQKVYKTKPGSQTARTNGSLLLTNPNVKRYLRYLKENIELTTGLSKERLVEEHKKIAFTSIAHLHNTWIERKDFALLTEEQKAAIQEITTQVRRVVGGDDEDDYEIEFVKIKLYDKQRSIDSLAKLLGHEAVRKLDVTTNGKPLSAGGTVNVQINVYNNAPPLARDEKTIKD